MLNVFDLLKTGDGTRAVLLRVNPKGLPHVCGNDIFFDRKIRGYSAGNQRLVDNIFEGNSFYCFLEILYFGALVTITKVVLGSGLILQADTADYDQPHEALQFWQ